MLLKYMHVQDEAKFISLSLVHLHQLALLPSVTGLQPPLDYDASRCKHCVLGLADSETSCVRKNRESEPVHAAATVSRHSDGWLRG